MNRENRTKLIKEKKFQIYYEEFMLQNENEPFPGTSKWKNNVNFMIWIQQMHREFKKKNHIPDFYPSYDPNYITDFKKWLADRRKNELHEMDS